MIVCPKCGYRLSVDLEDAQWILKKVADGKEFEVMNVINVSFYIVFLELDMFAKVSAWGQLFKNKGTELECIYIYVYMLFISFYYQNQNIFFSF